MTDKKIKSYKPKTLSLILDLPEFITKILKTYDKSGDIKINKFIQDSIHNYAEHCIGHPISINSSTPIKIQLPASMVWKLLEQAINDDNTTVSDIVAEALSYSISNLLSEIDAITDYNLEIAQKSCCR